MENTQALETLILAALGEVSRRVVRNVLRNECRDFADSAEDITIDDVTIMEFAKQQLNLTPVVKEPLNVE